MGKTITFIKGFVWTSIVILLTDLYWTFKGKWWNIFFIGGYFLIGWFIMGYYVESDKNKVS